MPKRSAKWMAVALIVLACLLLSWLQPLGRSRSLQFAMQTDVSLTAWIYSKPVARLLSDYQAQHPEVNIEIRIFRSEERLYEELAAAISTHATPHMAEIGSGPGLGPLADSGALVPWDAEDASAVEERYAEAFRHDGRLWALPYGAVLSVLYYNENLLRRPAGSPAVAGELTWAQLTEQAMKMTQDVNGDGVTDIWGFVADGNAARYLSGAIAAGGGAAAEAEASSGQLFRVWHDLVFRYKAMPALEHHLALSSFIDGAAGLLLAPSDIRNMLEEYIGGTFGFGLLPVPLRDRNEAAAVRVSGLARLRSEPETELLAGRIAAYLLEPETQRRLFAEASKLPVAAGMLERWMENPDAWTEREAELLRIAGGKLRIEASEAMGKTVREQVRLIQEQLEGSAEVCIPCMAQSYRQALTEGERTGRSGG
ncbi:ABC transporter substrate-binding protein [Cohnella cellulosilytica]|uniref:ABC transporter substrate-binding protein n=1 Tax=Cohnella cellulosilytica TaxID=986710 RepID=A0ABW2FJU6_9BACL